MTKIAGLLRILSLALLCVSLPCTAETSSSERDVIELSRSIAVRILFDGTKPTGSGFFINDNEIVTCFHVVSDARTWKVTVDDKQVITDVSYRLFTNLQAVLNNGEIVPLELVSIPNKKHAEPILRDFAILRLAKPAKYVARSTRRYQEGTSLAVGDPVFFTGYPLDTEILLTHKGTIAGIDPSTGVIALQAPINKGTSGSAVLSADGTILGIISNRLGGIGKGLYELREQIEASSAIGNIEFVGINPLQATKNVIEVVDMTISTGIGYARSTVFLDKYLKDLHLEVEKK